MNFEGYKGLVGKLNPKILADMVRFSEELSDDQREALYALIEEAKH